MRVLIKVKARTAPHKCRCRSPVGQAVLPMPKALGALAADAGDRPRTRRDLDRRRGGARIAPRTRRRVPPELNAADGARWRSCPSWSARSSMARSHGGIPTRRRYAAIAKIFQTAQAARLTLVDGNRLALRPSPTDQDWLEDQSRGLDRPRPRPPHASVPGAHARARPHLASASERASPTVHSSALPSLEPGRYTVFADIVGQSGFPWTLVGTIDLPAISGAPLSGDDCGGHAPALASSSDSTVDVLDDGTHVVWHRDPAPFARTSR